MHSLNYKTELSPALKLSKMLLIKKVKYTPRITENSFDLTSEALSRLILYNLIVVSKDIITPLGYNTATHKLIYWHFFIFIKNFSSSTYQPKIYKEYVSL